ncbi:uncharacterized protein UDID_17886 [Ustilago sp. UG-2017a]|nr:uncharacterized protein UDID_17886 [Ustilago sp. UG-2017a]
MTTSTDNSLDISAQLFQQSTTPTSSATQTESMPALSQSSSTSTPDIHTSCPTQASRSAIGNSTDFLTDPIEIGRKEFSTTSPGSAQGRMVLWITPRSVI